MPSKKYSVKSENIKNWFIVLGLTVLFIGCFLLAVITPFAITLHDKIASADSTDGVVEDNLLLDGDNFASSVWINDRNTIIQYTPYLSMTSSIAWTGFSQNISSSLRNTTITCSALVKVSNGTGALGFRYRQGSSGGTTSLGQVSFTNSDWQVKSWTATVPDISLSLLRLVIYCQTVGVQVDVKWVKVEVGTSFTGYVPNNYTNYGYNQGLEEGYNNGLSHGVLSFGFNSADNLSVDLTSLYSRGSYSGAYPDGIFDFDGIPYGYHGLYHYLISTDPVVQMDCYSSYGSAVNGLYPSVGFKYVSNYDIKGDILINMPWVSVNGSLTSSIQPVQVAFMGRDTGSVLYVSQLDSLHWFNAGYLYSFDATVIGTTPVQYNVYLITISVHFDEPVDIYFLPQYYNNSVSYQHIFMPSIDSRFGVFYSSDTSSIYGINRNGIEAYNSGYNSGYDYGYDLGFDDGVDSVNVSAIESVAKQEGLTQGRNEGWDRAERFYHVGQYSDGTRFDIETLLFSVVDAPLQAGFKMFDFEILGYNMRDLLFSFLTIGIILFTIKKFVV